MWPSAPLQAHSALETNLHSRAHPALDKTELVHSRRLKIYCVPKRSARDMEIQRKPYTTLFWFLSVLLWPAQFVLAQTSSIVGTVRDSSGLVVSGATVTAIGTATGVTRSTVTNDRGDFVFSSVVAGEYDL